MHVSVISAWLHFSTFCLCVRQRARVVFVNKPAPVRADSLMNRTLSPTLLSVWIEISPTSNPLRSSFESRDSFINFSDLIKKPGAGMKAATSHYLTPLAAGMA